jgi:very-short-patch-repair endonuclease
MRRELTEPERRLWHALRAGRLEGAKFRRQVVIGPYIADFACRTPKMLVIEVDGESHAEAAAYDHRRSHELKTRGYETIRFPNHDVMSNLDGVLLTIQKALGVPLSPTLSPEGEREKGN